MTEPKANLDSLMWAPIIIDHVNFEQFILKIPKAELHVHIEGTLEPDLMFELAKRNEILLKYKSVEDIKKAYSFSNLQSFLDIYYEGSNVLLQEEDFFDLTLAYIKKLHEQNVIYSEIFFDPQAHTARGVPIARIIRGINGALVYGKEKYRINTKLIMCFLRHLSEESAMQVLKESLPYKEYICGVGLDSSEVGHPPSKFSRVFNKAREYGYYTVAHAGEEGPPEYIWEALNDLKVMRIDHGVRCIEDEKLVEELLRRKIPLTVCPFSNIKLGVFSDLKDHNIKCLLDKGLRVTVNSDDPAYFGGYLAENLIEVQKVLGLNINEVCTLAKNSFLSAFLTDSEKSEYVSKLDNFVSSFYNELKC